MNKKQLCHLVDELKAGHYLSSIKYIKEKKLLLESNGSKNDKLNLLFSIVHGLEATSESPMDVIRMLRMLKFEKLEETDLTNYLSSVYRIANHAMNLGKLDLIEDLQHYLKPPFLSETQLNKTHINCMKHMLFILHKNFTQLLENHTAETIQTYLKLLFDLNILTAEDDYLPRFEKYFSHLIFKEYNSERIKELCEYLLETNAIKNFKDLSSLLGVLCKGFLAKKEYEMVGGCWLIFHDRLMENVGDDVKVDFDSVSKKFQVLLTSGKLYSAEHLDCFIKVFNGAKDLKPYIDYLIPIMVQVLLEFIIASREETTQFPNELFVPFFKLCNELTMRASKINYKCCCDIKYDVSTVGNVILVGSYLFKYLSSSQCDDDSFKAGKEHFLNNLPFLYEMKKNKCKVLEKVWTFQGSVYCKVGSTLYQANNPLCVEYLQTFIKAATKLEIIPKETIKIALNMLGIYKITNKSFKEGLYIAALNMLLQPDNNNNAGKQWVSAKHSLGTAYDDVTIVTVLNKSERKIKSEYFEDFVKLTDQKKIVDLLKLELDIYKRNWPFIIYKHLINFAKYANYTEIASEIAAIDYSILIKFEQNFSKEILQPAIEEYKKSSCSNSGTCDSYLLLGYLNFLKYKFLFNEIVVKNDKDLQRSDVPDLKSKLKSDSDEIGDINAGYLYLQISACDELLRFLDESLAYLKAGVKLFGTGEDAADKIRVVKEKDCPVFMANLVNAFVELAYEFKLHCNLLSFLDAMFATYKIAEALNDLESMVQINTGIIMHLRIDSEMFLSLKDECGRIVEKYTENEENKMNICEEKNEEKVDKTEKKEVKSDKEKNINTICCRYYTSLSLTYTKSSEIEMANKYYKQAYEYYMKIKKNETIYDAKETIVKVHFLFLEELLSNTACHYSKIDFKHGTLNPLHSSYCMLVSIFKTGRRICSELLSVSLEALETLLNFYTSMRLPREVIVYGTGVYNLIQKLVLPFWVVKVTISLARADMLSCKYVDCEHKLEKTSKILGLALENISTIAMSFANPESDAIKTTIQLPEFISHDRNCECFSCKSIVYKDLIMQKIHLDGLLHEVHKDVVTAGMAYKNVADFYKRVNKEQIEVPKNVILNTGFYRTTYDQYMLDCIRFQWRLKEEKEAAKLCEEVIAEMESEFNLNQHLCHEALNNFCWILRDECDPVVTAKIKIKVEETEEEKTPIKKKLIVSTPSPVRRRSPQPPKSLKKREKKNFAFLSPESPIAKSHVLKITQKNLMDDLKEVATPKSKEPRSAKKGKEVKIFCDTGKAQSHAVPENRPRMGLRRFLDGPVTPQPAARAKLQRDVKSISKISKSAIKAPSAAMSKPETRKNLFSQISTQNGTNDLTKCIEGIRSLSTGDDPLLEQPAPKTTSSEQLFQESIAIIKSKEALQKGAIRKYTRNKDETKKAENTPKPQRGRPKKLDDKTVDSVFDELKCADLPKENIFHSPEDVLKKSDSTSINSKARSSAEAIVPKLRFTNENGDNMDGEVDNDPDSNISNKPLKSNQSGNKEEVKEPAEGTVKRSNRLKKAEEEKSTKLRRAAAKKYIY